jgi:hypothetical protein
MVDRIIQIAKMSWGTRMSFGELAEELGLKSAWHAGQMVGRAWRSAHARGDAGACAAISKAFWPKDRV